MIGLEGPRVIVGMIVILVVIMIMIMILVVVALICHITSPSVWGCFQPMFENFDLEFIVRSALVVGPEL